MADLTALATAFACMALVVAGSAIQVAVGAGLSVVCGPFMLLWLGASSGVPILLCLNLLLSVVATTFGGLLLPWRDVVLVSGATLTGCAAAAVLPGLPDPVLRGITAGVLILAALPRPTARGAALPHERSAQAWIALAGLVTGVLTVWTATPGPVTPVAMARAGRPGAEIRRMMQPISVLGYGAALLSTGLPRYGSVNPQIFIGLIVAALAGTGLGFLLRNKVHPRDVVLLIRVIAAVAAVMLIVSLVYQIG